MKSIIKRAIAVLLIFTVVLLASCSMDLSPVKAAEIGDNADLDGYGAYISNDELGAIVSYGGYISKTEYASMLNDNSVGASYNPSFAGCYDTNGYQIYVRRAMAGQYVGESALLISVNGSRAYCIEPGEALNAYSNLTETTSSGVWASLSGNHSRQSIQLFATAERATSQISKAAVLSTPISATLRRSLSFGKSSTESAVQQRRFH